MAQKHSSLNAYQVQLQKAYERVSDRYRNTAPLIDEVGDALLWRAQFLKFQPKVILDLGAGQGFDSKRLQNAFPHAEIYAIDFSLPQLQKLSPTPHITRCQALVTHLPFKAHSIDCIFANLLLPALIDYESFWNECLRVLKPQGVLLFSSIGPFSFNELKESLIALDQKHTSSMNIFPDMHDVGDSLIQAGFKDPALDSETITLHYSNLKSLLHDLKNLGSIKMWDYYPHSYKGKQFWPQVEQYYQAHFNTPNQKLKASVEVYYAIAFAPTQLQHEDKSVSIPLSQIKKVSTHRD